MSWSTASIQGLLQRLESGWTTQSSLPQDFVECWKERMGGTARIRDADQDVLYFSADLSAIHLRGTEEIHCLLISGKPNIDTVKAHYDRIIAPGRLVVVLCAGPIEPSELHTVASWSRCMLVGHGDFAQFMNALAPLSWLKQALRERINRYSLIPFNILLPAQGNMFYGRAEELARLVNDDESTFAVAGPSRIGKTSLVTEYRRTLSRKGHYLAKSTVYIDCYECVDTSESGFVRFLARRLDGSSYGNRVQPENFAQFLKYLHSKLGQIPNIILDETDELCNSPVMRQLSTLSKNGHCRVIFCGRGNLLRTALESQSTLGGRLELVRLKALDEESAWKLFTEPLQDLNIAIDDEAVKTALRWTGCLPHLLQFFGLRLCQLTIEQRRDAVGSEQVDELRWDFETAQYFTSPLADVGSPQSKLIALALLKQRPKSINYSLVVELAKSYALTLSLDDSKRICNELVICNLLTWAGDSVQSLRGPTVDRPESPASYRIATEALFDYAEKMGFLTEGLDEVRRQLHKKPGEAK